MKITKRKIEVVYNKICTTAYKKFKKENLEAALNYISNAASWMYSFNLIYADERLDNLIINISNKFYNNKKIEFNPISDRVVFIDSFAWDNRGLTQQYLRALFDQKVKIKFILTSGGRIGENILNELKEYNNCEIEIVPKGKLISMGENLVKSIEEFKPSKIFLHLTPWDVAALFAISIIKGSTTYNINLTDHAFWLGSYIFDYNIEFRSYGERVSLEKRGFKLNQLLKLPYYPIETKKIDFKGFPDLPENCIKVFTGGSEYKMLGKNGIFFKIMDELLNLSKNVVILVAGISKDSKFNLEVQKIKNKDRVFLIGTRKDIDEVYKNSDIFLVSYPFNGGLMTQYAAYNSLPILSYIEGDEVFTITDVINQKKIGVSNFLGMENFLGYAKNLFSDIEYRKNEGAKNKIAMITPSEFNKLFRELHDDNKSISIIWNEIKVDYEKVINFFLDVDNNFLHDANKKILNIFKLESFIIYPERLFSFLDILIGYIIRRFNS